MKRIIISLALLAACAIGAVIETAYISSSVDSYTETIDRNDEWTDSAHGIDALLIHDYVDGIGLGIAQMKSHIESGNPDMYFSESEKTKKALASIKDSEYPYAENIL